MRGGAAALKEVVKSTSTAAEPASLVLMRAALKTNEAFNARFYISNTSGNKPRANIHRTQPSIAAAARGADTGTAGCPLIELL